MIRRLVFVACVSLLGLSPPAIAEVESGSWGEIVGASLFAYDVKSGRFVPDFKPGTGIGYQVSDDFGMFVSFNFLWGNREIDDDGGTVADSFLPTVFSITLGGTYQNVAMAGVNRLIYERLEKPAVGRWRIPFGLAGEPDIE